MKTQITHGDIKENVFFWYSYISWFRGFDDEKEINIDEALEIIEIDREQLSIWENEFFLQNEEEARTRFIEEKLNEDITLTIEFRKFEIAFFLNGIYIGNLGGHFEAWFFTWKELLAFQEPEYLFLLLLPMTGIEEHESDEARIVIANYLKTIPQFESNAGYIAKCILNGIRIDGQFSCQDEIGVVSSQNHSVRNIEKYPRYKDGVVKLNGVLEKLIEKK